jgi:L-alanine-DL-glutamate epimerase-like enolase superfamily enzyme
MGRGTNVRLPCALTSPAEPIVDGHFSVPQSPGLGATLDDAMLKEHWFDPLAV